MTTESPEGKRNAEARDARLRLRSWLWDHTNPAARLRVASCGRKRVAEYVQVRANHGAAAAGLGGLSTCGSVWVCPMCSAKVAGSRSQEVQDTVRAWQARPGGGSVVLVTLTLKHSRRHALADTWDAISDGWASVRNGKPWKADCAQFGIAGYVRVVEVTHGRHGWHPHVHALLFVEGTPTPEDVEALRSRIFGRWSRRLARRYPVSRPAGFVGPMPLGKGFKTAEFDKDGNPVGVDVRVARAHDVAYLADYLAKFGYAPKGTADGSTGSWSIAREVSRGDLKRGRKGSRTPWQILEAAADGSRHDRALWAEWEKASRGRRQYAWAQGFRESLDLDTVKTDEDLAAQADQALDVVALLPGAAWRGIVNDLRRLRDRPGEPLLVRMLDAAATLPPVEFRSWLASRGVGHVDPGAAAAVGAPVVERLDQARLSVPARPLDPGKSGTLGGTFPARTATWNEHDRAHREASLALPGDRPVEHPCGCCGEQLAPAYRAGAVVEVVDHDTGEIHEHRGRGVHPGCTPDAFWLDERNEAAILAAMR